MNGYSPNRVDSLIVDWYLVWKNSLFNEDGSSNLPSALYMLKQWIKYNEFENIDLNKKEKEYLYVALDLWATAYSPGCQISKDGNLTHDFGVKKEILRNQIAEIFIMWGRCGLSEKKISKYLDESDSK